MRGKPADAAAARQPDQHGLGLIVERVGGEHMLRAGLARARRRAAGSAPAAPPPAARSTACVPVQRSVRCATPSERASRFTAAASRRASGAQAMIDGDRDELRPALAAPSRQRAASTSSAVESGPPETARTMDAGQIGKIGEQRLATSASVETRLALVSSGHASARARRPASRSRTRADTCGRPRRTWRRPFPSA